ncbi:MAG: hypothetical protein GH158_01385 [Dehalococcoidia bacterium]|nr:hypothetical protein [Dehalococcoidia bacterium]
MMSEEQLRTSLQEISGELEELSSLERPLTKEEEKHRKRLRFRNYVLDRIKEAKDKDQKSDELYNTTYYQMLVPWGEKHPILFFFWMRIIRARWWGVSAYSYGDVWKGKEK